MKRLLPLAIACLALTLSSGCLHFRTKAKSNAKREDPHIATSVEKEFQENWIAHRTNELINQNINPETAREQAALEFDKQYPLLRISHQPPPQ